jgi:hypothetical protein
MWIGNFEKIKWGDDWISLWKFYSLLVSDPHQGESLDVCDELFWDVILI